MDTTLVGKQIRYQYEKPTANLTETRTGTVKEVVDRSGGYAVVERNGGIENVPLNHILVTGLAVSDEQIEQWDAAQAINIKTARRRKMNKPHRGGVRWT